MQYVAGMKTLHAWEYNSNNFLSGIKYWFQKANFIIKNSRVSSVFVLHHSFIIYKADSVWSKCQFCVCYEEIQSWSYIIHKQVTLHWIAVSCGKPFRFNIWTKELHDWHMVLFLPWKFLVCISYSVHTVLVLELITLPEVLVSVDYIEYCLAYPGTVLSLISVMVFWHLAQEFVMYKCIFK